MASDSLYLWKIKLLVWGYFCICEGSCSMAGRAVALEPPACATQAGITSVHHHTSLVIMLKTQHDNIQNYFLIERYSVDQRKHTMKQAYNKK